MLPVGSFSLSLSPSLSFFSLSLPPLPFFLLSPLPPSFYEVYTQWSAADLNTVWQALTNIRIHMTLTCLEVSNRPINPSPVSVTISPWSQHPPPFPPREPLLWPLSHERALPAPDDHGSGPHVTHSLGALSLLCTMLLSVTDLVTSAHSFYDWIGSPCLGITRSIGLFSGWWIFQLMTAFGCLQTKVCGCPCRSLYVDTHLQFLTGQMTRRGSMWSQTKCGHEKWSYWFLLTWSGNKGSLYKNQML